METKYDDINGLLVRMTPKTAGRWNRGDPKDLRAIEVYDHTTEGYVPMRRREADNYSGYEAVPCDDNGNPL